LEQRSLDDQNKASFVDKFYSPLIFQYLGVKAQCEDHNAKLFRRQAQEQALKLHALQDAGVQN
jgi:hypothetical protein